MTCTSESASMPPRVASLSSRPTQLKALPGGLVCDSRKTPPPRRKILKEGGGGIRCRAGGMWGWSEPGDIFIQVPADGSLSSRVDVGAASVLLDADDRPTRSSTLLYRGWSPKIKQLKDDKPGGGNRATGQFDPVCKRGAGLDCGRRSDRGDGGMFWAKSRRAAAAGGMKAPRRPRQTRLLPRFCVCGVGLLAAAWIFHLSDVTGASQEKK